MKKKRKCILMFGVIISILAETFAFAKARVEETDRGTAYITDETLRIPTLVSSLSTRNADGVWKEDANGWWFEYSNGGHPSSTWEEINSYWYYFNTNGYMVTGWIQVNGFWYFCETSGDASAPHGSMITGWREVNDEWYFFETAGTSSQPLGSMISGWFEYENKEYFFRTEKEDSHPEGSMVTGWKYFGKNSTDKWCFFNYDSGECAEKGQGSQGCTHGKTTYLDLKLDTDISNAHYMYTGNKFVDQIEEGTNTWNKSSAGVNFSPGVAAQIAFADASLEPNYNAVTKFVINGTVVNDPRTPNMNWKGADIRLNTSKQLVSRTIVHELGHALGLDHRDADNTSIMYTSVSATSLTAPAAIDIANVRHIYYE